MQPGASAAPRVSAVIPVYNRERCVAAAIQSVLGQTVPVHELIVVDDGSTDQSRAAILEGAAGDPRVRYLHQPNAGAAAARNTGIGAATGDWIAFLDSDDIWTPQKMAHALDVIRTRPDVEFIHTNRTQRLPDGTIEPGRLTDPAKLADKHYLLNGFNIKTTTVMIKSSLLRSIGGLFATDMRTCEDYELFWRAVCKAREVAYVASCDAVVHLTDDGLSRTGRQLGLITDNIAAMSRAADWIESQQPSNPQFAATLRALLYWEYKALLSLMLRSRNYAAARRAWSGARAKLPAIKVWKLAASASLSALRESRLPG